MAVRIEFFTIAGTGDFELVEHTALDAAVAAFDDGAAPGDGPVRCVGWVSASDDDEEHFTDWCAEVDHDLGVGFLRQGIDEAVGLTVPTPVAAAVVDADADAWEAAWAATMRAALAEAAGGRLGWRTSFDLGGTAGTHEDHPTAVSAG